MEFIPTVSLPPWSGMFSTDLRPSLRHLQRSLHPTHVLAVWDHHEYDGPHQYYWLKGLWPRFQERGQDTVLSQLEQGFKVSPKS
jgi:hypothetical protein